MGLLPTARTLTFIPGDPIPAALLNELQDMIIGKKFPTRTLRIPVHPPQGTGAGVTVVYGGGTNWELGFQIDAGWTITAIRARIKDSATGPTTTRFRLLSQVDGGGFTTLATSNTSAGSGAAQTIQATGLAVVIAASGAMLQYELLFDNPAGAANCNLFAIEMDVTNL